MTHNQIGELATQIQGEFIPWIYSISSRVHQVELREMAYDPNVMSTAVLECAELFNPKVISVNLDPTVWAEAVGCEVAWGNGFPVITDSSGFTPNPDVLLECERVQVLRDAIERTRASIPNSLLACAINGPGMLSALLPTDEPMSDSEVFLTGECVSEAARMVCETGVDLLVIMEEKAINNSVIEYWLMRGIYRQIGKIAAYYSVATVLLSPGYEYSEALVAETNTIEYWIGNTENIRHSSVNDRSQFGHIVNGFGAEHCELEDMRKLLKRLPGFLTTPWDLDPDTDLTSVHRDVSTVRKFLMDIAR